MTGFGISVFALQMMAQVGTCVLSLDPSPANPRNSEGDFIRLRDGRLLFVYTHFTGDSSDFGTSHLAGRFSEDGGRTWTNDDILVLANEGAVNTMSVSLLRLQDGRIGLFYLVKGTGHTCMPFVRFSGDEAGSWGDRVPCAAQPGYYVVNNARVVQLASGRILVPAAKHPVHDGELDQRSAAFCFLSDDAGATWRPSKPMLEGPPDSRTGLQEPGLVECADGRLLMLARTDQGCQFQSHSDDGGITWSPAQPTGIASPVSPATLARIPGKDTLLMVWNNHHHLPPNERHNRTPLTIAFSEDNGLSWGRARTLEEAPDGWYCYTAVAFTEEALLLAYCAGDAQAGRLNRTRIVRIPLADLGLDG